MQRKIHFAWFLFFILVMLITAHFLVGCNTTAERRGYSSIPQNHPASWSSGGAGGVNF